jgi:hypothetical protein
MKEKIPKALREQVWVTRIGRKFEHKCMTTWCHNNMTVFDFQCGHDVPESKGGSTDILNLIPICSRCNSSMSNNYTFKEWCDKSSEVSKWKVFFNKFAYKPKDGGSEISEQVVQDSGKAVRARKTNPTNSVASDSAADTNERRVLSIMVQEGARNS